MKKLVINEKNNNKKIVQVLLNTFDGLSSSFIYKVLRQKDIKLNGKRIKENIAVFEGDILEVFIDDKYLYKKIPLDIIYEDENILIVNKPKGIEVLNSDNISSLTDIIQTYFNKKEGFPFPCHRLDRNTSGLVLYAKNPEALTILNEKVKNHEILKFYQCTVIGILKDKENTLTDYLFKDSKEAVVYINSVPKPGYRKIITSYRVIKEDIKNNLSVLEVQLLTGRTHQIRAHLAYIGHPILGDGKYGINEINKKFNKKTQELISYKLVFNFKTDSGILNYLNGKEIELY